MLSLVRPDAHASFSGEAVKALDAVRLAVAGRRGAPHGDDFKNRMLWSKAPHKHTLAGSPLDGRAKCAWCERVRDVQRELDVEHYRPKVAVTQWAGAPPLVSDTPPSEIHIGPGYWWLAFSWDNYSLACAGCNRGWKRNLFPMAAPRPTCVVGVEVCEQPLLLNPMVRFRTGDHFTWTFDAHMEAASDRGEATIVTCGLNRKELVAARLKVLVKANGVLHALVGAARRRDRAVYQRALESLAYLGARTSEFAGMVRWFAERSLGEWAVIEGLPD